MGVKSLNVEKNNLNDINFLSKIDFEKKYLIGTGGFSKVT
jgi:hypothetical protein